MKYVKSFCLILAAVLLLTGCNNPPSTETSKSSSEYSDSTAQTAENQTEPSESGISPVVVDPTTNVDPDTGEYKNEIDDWALYTEHNLDDYVRVDAEGKKRFYASEMATDVFPEPVAASKKGQVTLVPESREYYITLTYGKYDDNNERTNDGDWYGFILSYRGYSMIVKCKPADGYKLCYIDESNSYGVTYDLAAISLFVCESVAKWDTGADYHGYWNDLGSHLSWRFYIQTTLDGVVKAQ